jgi:hypothetical protein
LLVDYKALDMHHDRNKSILERNSILVLVLVVLVDLYAQLMAASHDLVLAARRLLHDSPTRNPREKQHAGGLQISFVGTKFLLDMISDYHYLWQTYRERTLRPSLRHCCWIGWSCRRHYSQRNLSFSSVILAVLLL